MSVKNGKSLVSGSCSWGSAPGLTGVWMVASLKPSAPCSSVSAISVSYFLYIYLLGTGLPQHTCELPFSLYQVEPQLHHAGSAFSSLILNGLSFIPSVGPTYASSPCFVICVLFSDLHTPFRLLYDSGASSQQSPGFPSLLPILTYDTSHDCPN